MEIPHVMLKWILRIMYMFECERNMLNGDQ